MRHRTTDYVEVSDAVYKRYCFSQTVSGLLLQEALQIAKGIDADTKFKASNGWLDSLIAVAPVPATGAALLV